MGIFSRTTGNATTSMMHELLRTINERIVECEDNIKKHERREVREVMRGDGEEVRKVTTVVGAEEYRKQLSTLIRQKLELTGDTESLYSESSAIEGFGNAHIYDLGRKVEQL